MKKLNELGKNIVDENLIIGKKVLEKGTEIPPHNHEGFKTIVVMVEGQLEAKADDKEFMIEKGDVIDFQMGEKFSCKALVDSEFRVILIKR